MNEQYGILKTWVSKETGEKEWAFTPVKTLTDEEILKLAEDEFGHAFGLYNFIAFARAILRKAQENG